MEGGDARRWLPKVDALLGAPEFAFLLEAYPRARVVEALRVVLAEARSRGGEPGGAGAAGTTDPAGAGEWARRVQERLQEADRPSLRPVLNATGVLLHTNLGRAPLSRAAQEAMYRAARGYSNLEFDLEAGERGRRYVHCVGLLRELTGAPDALVVNNNAAAVLLALHTLAEGREVLVSRGELVEIGGGFRIPEILARSGAVLREVGTTNRTRLGDYRRALRPGVTAAILKVHRSNFRITGFTEEASLPELAALARETGIFLLHDLGSGLFAPPQVLGLPPEPRATESLQQGVHAVAVSGDKLLGGPQAGILLGEAEVIGRMRENPLCRALRVDKVTLAGLEATLRHYLDPEEALREVPVLRMLRVPLGELESRARQVAVGLDGTAWEARLAPGIAAVGGGTYPGVEIPSWTVRLRHSGFPAHEAARRLRTGEPPVVGRVEEGELVLDLRSVDPEEVPVLVARLREVGGDGG